MIKWFKKYGGFAISAILGVIGLICFSAAIAISYNFMTKFILAAMGFTSITMSGGVAYIQYDKNKKLWIVKNKDLKEDNLTKPYEPSKEISKVTHYSKKYVIENNADTSQNNENNLTL